MIRFGVVVAVAASVLSATAGVIPADFWLRIADGRMAASPAAGARLEQQRDEVREEFHQTYPLTADGLVSLKNINGAVRIAAWERNEVKVDAIKRASTPERLAEAEIKINAAPDAIRIETKYAESNFNWTDKDGRRYYNPASIEYSLTVPRGARLRDIELINGSLDVDGVTGEVRASCINGRLTARRLGGEAKLSTINGRLDVTFERLGESQNITLGSVNASVVLTLPSDADAQIRAHTIHGGITNNFGLLVRRGEYVGHDLAGTLGSGAAKVKLSNVNGSITIQRANDGRQVKPVTNLLAETDAREREMRLKARAAALEAQRAARAAQLEAQRAARAAQAEAQRAARESQLEAQRTARAAREARLYAGSSRDYHRFATAQETRSFAVSGMPNVKVDTFDGHVTVRAWDKPEVMFRAIKRAESDEALRSVSVRSDQRGADVWIIAEPGNTAKQRGSIDASVAFEVFVPRRANLRVVSGDGHLQLEGVSGEADLRTGDGQITVSGGRGRLRANTGDGHMSITGYEGEVEARTGDGRITLDGRFTGLSARTGNGPITLALPANTNATIETTAESVTTDGLAVAEDSDKSRRVRRWRIGRGGTLFTLRTGDGLISLRRANQ